MKILAHVHCGDKCQEVEGKLLPCFHAGQDFVLHQSTTERQVWHVTDVLTGLKIGSGKTQKVALVVAQRVLEGYIVERYHEVQCQAVLKHYRDGRTAAERDRAAQRKTITDEVERGREINDLIRVMRHDEITVDGIMDIAKIAVLTVECWD